MPDPTASSSATMSMKSDTDALYGEQILTTLCKLSVFLSLGITKSY
jgi:hypothetical protein